MMSEPFPGFLKMLAAFAVVLLIFAFGTDPRHRKKPNRDPISGPRIKKTPELVSKAMAIQRDEE
jgi:hypothetical protein